MQTSSFKTALRLPASLALASALILGLAASPPAAAQERSLRLDPKATRITFTLGATMHTVEGSARLKEGQLRVDPAAKTLAGRLVIDARSTETGNTGRDRKMHADVLQSERFPEIVLIPERFAGELAASGASTLTLHGKMEIHGGSHTVELPVELQIEGERFTARLTLTVPFVEWGMEDPSSFVLRVAKKVEVVVEATGSLTPPATEAAAE